MKKTIFTALFVLCGTLLWGSGGEKIDFFIKVKQGNPNVLERLYVLKFGDDFHYGVENKVFTVSASNADKIAFIDTLKKAGHLIEATDDPNQFFVVIFENGEQTVLYSIDSSYFKNSPQQIVVLQKIFGTTVSGGTQDLVKQKKSDLPTIQIELEKSGFECEIKDNRITVRERSYNRTFNCPDNLKVLIVQEITLLTGKKAQIGKNIQIAITNSQLQALQNRLLGSGLISKINIEKDGVIKLLPVAEKKYMIRIMLNNKFEYDKAVSAVEKLTAFRVIDKELQENRLGVAVGRLEVSTKDLSAGDLKNMIWQAIRNACPRLRERDIRVSEKGK